MATYSRRERTTTRIEYVVPASPPLGATWAQVQQAIDAMIAEVSEAVGQYGTWTPADDAVWILPGDGELIVYREVEVDQ